MGTLTIIKIMGTLTIIKFNKIVVKSCNYGMPIKGNLNKSI